MFMVPDRYLWYRSVRQRTPGEDQLPARYEAVQLLMRELLRFPRHAEIFDGLQYGIGGGVGTFETSGGGKILDRGIEVHRQAVRAAMLIQRSRTDTGAT